MQEVWFDYWYEGKEDLYINPEISYSFYKALYDLSPKCLVSTRIGSGLGDFAAAGDNEIPGQAKMAYWETPGTMNNTWGYSKFDNDWKSTEELIFWLVDIASKGGNYLLNMGPKADGTIPAQSLERLAGLGRWTKVNGESIYGTRRWLVDREGSTKPAMKGTAAARVRRVRSQVHRRGLLVHRQEWKGVRQRVHEAGKRAREGKRRWRRTIPPRRAWT